MGSRDPGVAELEWTGVLLFQHSSDRLPKVLHQAVCVTIVVKLRFPVCA